MLRFIFIAFIASIKYFGVNIYGKKEKHLGSYIQPPDSAIRKVDIYHLIIKQFSALIPFFAYFFHLFQSTALK